MRFCTDCVYYQDWSDTSSPMRPQQCSHPKSRAVTGERLSPTQARFADLCGHEGRWFVQQQSSAAEGCPHSPTVRVFESLQHCPVCLRAEVAALQSALKEAHALMRELLEEMDRLAGYGDEETDGAVYLTVHEWQERVRAFMEKDLLGC